MDKNTRKKLEVLPFEEALEKLEKTVEKMESGRLPLDDMMKSFEEGSVLAGVCGKKLKELEKKIEILVKDDKKDGEWKDFESGADPEPVELEEDSPEDEEELF